MALMKYCNRTGCGIRTMTRLAGTIVKADTVHHIVEFKEDYSQRCDMDNLISISEATHSMVSREYKIAAKKAAMQQTLRECMREYKRRLEGREIPAQGRGCRAWQDRPLFY